MGKFIVLAGIISLCIARVLFIFFIILSGSTSKRLRKELDKEYMGYK